MSSLGPHGVAAILVTLGALILFTRQRIPIEYSCIAILFALVLGFELFPFEHAGARLRGMSFLAGLGNEALISILLLLIVAKGVEISGALRPLARVLVRIWLHNRSLALLCTLVAVATLSAFVNNTPIVVMLLPILVGVAHRARIPPSAILMPAGFATIIGGMSTTIGTSTNLLVVSVAAGLGMPRLGMFDFLPAAAITAVVAIAYLWAIAPRLLPERQPPLAPSTPRLFESIIEVADYSPLAGKTFAEVRAAIKGTIRIRRVQRGKGIDLVRLPSLVLRSGDRVFVCGTAEGIKEVQDLFGGGFEDADLLRLPEHALVEVVVTRTSPLFEKRFMEARTQLLGDLIPVGIYRPGVRATERLDLAADPVLVSGDVLLLQGRRQDLRRLQDQHRLLVLDRNIHVPRTAKAPLALAITVAVIASAALGLVPIVASALCGAALMLFTRCLTLDEAWSSFDAKLVLVVVTSLALGTTLTDTGAADFLAARFVTLVGNLPPAVVLSAVLLAAALLTEIITNNAVGVIATPIAISAARELGVPELPFVLAVLFGANMSYMTPIGYQTNLLVFAAGGYRFSDFFRVGIPLQVIVWLTLSIVLPLLYL